MKKLVLAILCVLNLSVSAQTTAFTYQGKLSANGSATSGNYDLQFILFRTNQFGNAAAPILTNSNVTAEGGLFTTTLDFGSNVFTGSNYWLEIGVRTNGSTEAFTTLAPRQMITPTPYAINAASANSAANVTGNISDAQLSGNIARLNAGQTFSGALTINNASGTFSGNGTGLTNVNAATLNGLASASFWKTSGNGGTSPGTNFIGTSDNQALELKVNGTRALRLEPNTYGAPNFIGGAAINQVDAGVIGSTIVGGGAANYFGNTYTNRISSDFSFIGGGYLNTIQPSAPFSVIGGGSEHTIQNAGQSTIGGGSQHTIQSGASCSAIGGGLQNTIQSNASQSVIGGGFVNTIQTNASYSTIGGGYYNTIQSNAYKSAIGGGFFNTIQNNAYESAIGGGHQNTIGASAYNSAVGGGYANTIQSGASYSAIGGGAGNVNTGPYSAIPGGDNNVAGTNSFAAGHRAKATHTGSFVWADSLDADFATTGANQFLVRANGGVGINTSTTGGASLYVSGNRINGWPNSMAFFENTNTNVNAAPALRVLVQGANAPDGALSVSVNGNSGLLAEFGNAAAFVVKITNNGTIYATAFNTTSDRNLKENFSAVDAKKILEKVAALPVSEWNFKVDKDSKHIGPMAQDFYAAFGTGTDDKHIATVDEGGVALAAIQGLNEVLQEKDSEIRSLKDDNRSLEKRLSHLEQLVKALAEKR